MPLFAEELVVYVGEILNYFYLQSRHQSIRTTDEILQTF
jgi:hypothetical protein